MLGLPHHAPVSAPTTAEGIVTRGLVKEFPGVRALDGLDLDIPAGVLYGLVGPNGSGKTTLIRILMGLDAPTAGSARVRGVEPGARPRELGYMPQEEALYPDLSVEENVRFFAALYRAPRAAVRDVLELVGLWDERERLVGELSGGMRRRVSLAAALAHDPRALFLDEPTVGVDPLMRQDFWASFRERADSGASIIITTHHMEETRRCDRIGLLWRGRLLREGAPDELLEQAGTNSLDEAFARFVREAIA